MTASWDSSIKVFNLDSENVLRTLGGNTLNGGHQKRYGPVFPALPGVWQCSTDNIPRQA